MDSNFYKYRTIEEKQISLHDSIVDTIRITEDRIELIFENGFYILNVLPDGAVSSKGAKLVIYNFEDIENVSCKLFKRFKSPFGAKIIGKEIDINSISSKLKNKKLKVSIVDELRGHNHIYLRGTILPYKKYGLSDMIIIEIRGPLEVEYLWN